MSSGPLTAALTVSCPVCGAIPEEPCQDEVGRPQQAHSDRLLDHAALCAVLEPEDVREAA